MINLRHFRVKVQHESEHIYRLAMRSIECNRRSCIVLELVVFVLKGVDISGWCAVVGNMPVVERDGRQDTGMMSAVVVCWKDGAAAGGGGEELRLRFWF